MPLSLPLDTAPVAYSALPSNAVGLGWFNNNRKRLKKFADQYLDDAEAAVAVLQSQGVADVTLPAVVATRAGFNELRVRLPVLHQYYTYTLAHGGTGDGAVLAKIKKIVLAWVRLNQPTGKAIDETNFENLLRVIAARWGNFSTAEKADITAWLNALKTAKENWNFTPLDGEGQLQFGNHYTHHYKILVQLYQLLGLNTATLFNTIDAFALTNFPFNNAAITYPITHAVVGASTAEQRLDINGNHVGRFPAGVAFSITGNTQNNNGTYTVASSQFLSSSNKTRIFTVQSVQGNGGNGQLVEQFSAVHAMPRAATAAGESIDYIRRDALHYHHYNLEPWIEIALLEGGTRYKTLLENAFTFYDTMLFNPPAKHYEFAATTDSFDGLRWQASHPEYLQPNSMFRPEKIARVAFSYAHFQQRLNPSYTLPDAWLAFTLRSDALPSVWYYYFRWVFNGGYG